MGSVLRLLPVAIVVTESAAIVCQFVQRTDPRFPLVYFTVWSGVLAAAVAAVGLSNSSHRAVRAWRVASTVGVLLSAVIFAALIAPASATGTWFQPWDDWWVRVATLLFHGVAPVLVCTDLVVNEPRRLSFSWWICAGYAWPATYLASISVAALALHIKIPYPFLEPGKMGWGIVLVSLASTGLLIGILTAALYAAAVVAQGSIRDKG